MDWLKDKKNRLVVCSIAGVIVVALLVGVYMMVMKPSSDTSADMSATTSAPADGTAAMNPAGGTPPTDPNAPATSPAPGGAAPAPAPASAPGAAAPATGAPAAGATPAPASGGVQIAAVPMESWRSDPFLPVGYKPKPKSAVKPKPRIFDLPLGPLFPAPPMDPDKIKIHTRVELPQPSRRMAGLLLNNGIFAIIESNGSSEIVQPGDVLKDGLAVVEKIERDRVILKTRDKPARFLVIGMASAPKSAVINSDQSSGPSGASGSGVSGSSSPRGGVNYGPGLSM